MRSLPHPLALLAAALMLVACTSGTAPPASGTVPSPAPSPVPSAAPSPVPATEAPVPSAVPSPVPATEAPAPSAVPSPVPATEAPAPQLAPARGTTVLRLAIGSGPGQIGWADGLQPTFRIGGDGTIRVLDPANKRVLFFAPDGKPGRALALAEAQQPRDFIVNNAGEVFVFDMGAGDDAQVLRYGANGRLAARYPVSRGISVNAYGITLTADQTLMLTGAGPRVWTVLHRGVAVPPEAQPLTEQRGVASPRSPVLFNTLDITPPTLDIVALSGGITGDVLTHVQQLALQLPAGASVVNVDREMNLYATTPFESEKQLDVWRLRPDGSVAGGARIRTVCKLTARTFYIDQAGTAWTLCASPDGVTITRYQLLDAAGQPLPEAARAPAEVNWRPGANFRAA